MCVDSCMRAYGREGESKDRGGAGGRGWDTAPRTCGSAPRAGAEVASWEAGGSPWPQELCPYPSWATPGSDGSPGEWDDTWGSGWDSWQRGGIRLLERRRPCASGFTLDTEECPSEVASAPPERQQAVLDPLWCGVIASLTRENDLQSINTGIRKIQPVTRRTPALLYLWEMKDPGSRIILNGLRYTLSSLYH